MNRPVSSPYFMPNPLDTTVHRHTISVLVDNEPGVLARVIGLFSGRGYNIESLTVAEVDKSANRSRITVVTSGTLMVLEQIKHQLERLVPVAQVVDLTEQGPHISHEMALVKVRGSREDLIQTLRISDFMGAKMVDSTTESFVFELTGETAQVDSYIHMLEPFGVVEVSRTGAVAIARGPGTLSEP